MIDIDVGSFIIGMGAGVFLALGMWLLLDKYINGGKPLSHDEALEYARKHYRKWDN